MSIVLVPSVLPNTVWNINRTIFVIKRISVIERCRVLFLHNSAPRNCENTARLTKDSHFDKGSKLNLLSYYSDYIHNNSNKYSSVFKRDEFLHSLSDETSNLLKQFEFTSNEIEVTDEVKTQLTKVLSGLPFDEFLMVLDFFVNFFKKFKTKAIQPYLPIIEIIDNECVSRSSSLSKDEILKILYILYHAPCLLKFSYCWKKIAKFCYKLNSLSHVQTVQVLHLLTKFQKMPPTNAKFEFQEILNKIVPHLNVHELGLMLYVIYKINLKISHPDLLNKVLEKLLPDIESLDQEIIKSISLAYQKATKGNLKKLVNEFQEKLLPIVNKLDINVLTYAASCGIICSCINPTFLEEALKIVKKNISECSPFVLQRFCVLCSIFNFKDEELVKLIVAECCKPNFPSSHLVVIGKQLLCLGVFERKILNVILTDNFVKELLRRKEKALLVDYNCIQTSLELDWPEFNESKLSETSQNSLNKVFKKYRMVLSVETSKMFDRFWSKVQSTLEDIYGKNAVYWKQLIQCYHPFVFMRFDENLKPQPVPEEFLARKNVKIMRPMQDDHYWVPFVVMSMFKLHDSLDLITQTKMRHLNIIGYKPLLFTGYEWKKHEKEKREAEYLKGLLTTHLEMIVKNETQKKQTGFI